jgi:hypothetical protein
MGMGLAMTIIMAVMMVVMIGAMAWGALASLRARRRDRSRPD